MRTYFLMVLFIACTVTCLSQKPAIDTNAINNWTSIDGARISNNGLFVWYIIKNQPFGENTSVITDTKNYWKMKLLGVSWCQFSSDSKYAFFKNGNDSLGIIETGTPVLRYIPGVQSFNISEKGNWEWLIYQMNDPKKTLIIHSMVAGRKKSIEFVNQYILTGDGNFLLYVTGQENINKQQLHWLNLDRNEDKIIWQGENAGNFVLDNTNKLLAYSVDGTEKTVWLYKAGST